MNNCVDEESTIATRSDRTRCNRNMKDEGSNSMDSRSQDPAARIKIFRHTRTTRYVRIFFAEECRRVQKFRKITRRSLPTDWRFFPARDPRNEGECSPVRRSGILLYIYNNAEEVAGGARPRCGSILLLPRGIMFSLVFRYSSFFRATTVDSSSFFPFFIFVLYEIFLSP